MSKKICIISQTHLAFNPRVVKEANSLQSNGFDVTVLTVFFSREARMIDEKLNETGFNYRAAVNLIRSESGIAKTTYYRACRKLGIKLYEYFHKETPHSIMYGPHQLLTEAIACQADLYIGHTEVGLWICNKLAAKGYKVAYDFEDWYSHDYVRKSRPVKYLEALEKSALQNGCYITCPSQAMANIITKRYASEKPAVLYNGFNNKEKIDNINETSAFRKSLDRISFVWFSQTIGPGRGLERLIKTLNKVNFDFELHLIGKCSNDYKKLLENLFQPGAANDFFIHPAVPPNELISAIKKSDVGLALEENFPANKDLTVSNKILQYLQAGLTVVSSETEGQKEIAALSNGNVILFKNEKIPALESVLQQVNTLFKKQGLNKKRSVEAFQRHFAWEVQEKHLITLVKNALC